MPFAKREFEASPRHLLQGLREMAEAEPAPGAERAREWLVFAGQIEQAVADAGDARDITCVTDCAAALLLALQDGATGTAEVLRLRRALATDRPWADRMGSLRIPEGFAWYALYPEAHGEAARRWAAARWQGEPVTIVGLRSIGTTLSAVVCAALLRQGVPARRITLRPSGHPFARQVRLPSGFGTEGSVLVVDEGPGLSGSSMAGTAEAVEALGVAPGAIAFLPGHARGPGAEAGEAARRWWTAERCWLGSPPADAIPPQGGPLRWRFGGFAAVTPGLQTLAEVKRSRQQRLALHGAAFPCPGLAHGWIGVAEEGSAVTRDDLDGVFLRQTLARYIMLAARPAADDGAIDSALERIAAALGGSGLPADAAAACRGLPLAGDGRLSPGEWLRRADGRVLKRDATGTDFGHDWEGPQSVLWDVAGAAVEWDMDAALRRQLARQLAEAHGLVAEHRALAFHEAGYCCLQRARAAQAGRSAEQARYEDAMRAALARVTATA